MKILSRLWNLHLHCREKSNIFQTSSELHRKCKAVRVRNDMMVSKNAFNYLQLIFFNELLLFVSMDEYLISDVISRRFVVKVRNGFDLMHVSSQYISNWIQTIIIEKHMSENIPAVYQIMCNFLCRLLKTPLEFDSSALDDVVIIECSLQLLISSFHLEGSLRSVAGIKHTLIGCCIVITFSYLNSVFLVPALFRRGSVSVIEAVLSL